MIHKNDNNNNSSRKILPEDTEMALRRLILITRGLLDFAQQEERALTLGDMIQLSSLQDSKENIAQEYAQASREFRNRIEAFRGIDVSLLNQLEKLQNELNKKTQDNNILLEQLHRRALANTQATLVTAQELGQPVRFANERNRHEQRENI